MPSQPVSSSRQRRLQRRVLVLFFFPLLLLLASSFLVGALNIEQTSGIFGAIQFLDKPTTAARLLEQCFTGFALNSCQDLNATDSTHKKDYAFASQFTDPVKQNQPYCLQCCTRPIPRITGADETWNLSCPLNDLQRLSVSKGRRTFRFAARKTLADEEIIECAMPPRTPSKYLDGYTLTLFIEEKSLDFGLKYWKSVVNCSVSIHEVSEPPTQFYEVIRIRSLLTAQPRPTSWILPFWLNVAGLVVVLSVPLYNAFVKGKRCVHCGSWLVFVNQLCVICICVSCSVHPPPAKVYVDNGDPHRESTVEEDDDDEDGDSEEEEDSSSSEEEDNTTRVKTIKNTKGKRGGK